VGIEKGEQFPDRAKDVDAFAWETAEGRAHQSDFLAISVIILVVSLDSQVRENGRYVPSLQVTRL